jgi:hypothetical protein
MFLRNVGTRLQVLLASQPSRPSSINIVAYSNEKNAAGRACSTLGRNGKYVHSFESENPKERDRLEEWEDNIKMNLRDIRWEGEDWPRSAQVWTTVVLF